MNQNAKVNAFLEKDNKWKEEFIALRHIVCAAQVVEKFKWGNPCYTVNGKNVVLIHGFKEYCALLFMKGALLTDSDGLLVQQTENVQAARQIRFKNLQEIESNSEKILSYINQAIEVEKAGLKVEVNFETEKIIPLELQQKFQENPELEEAFEKLTPGRQRAYLLYFSQAKQAKTREARIKKYVQPILDGKGLKD
ncbi:YdeI/OmpD-associated family protein [Alkalicoccobacillus gibsonii]|uniref:YdeI/OmpD-associated family protein n=1 Tax=Alkalicoccobacillus gibsonii TaxID=79881 RepID=A0ABU9VHN3_9BACI